MVNIIIFNYLFQYLFIIENDPLNVFGIIWNVLKINF
jgi:hypothetical protein